MGAVGDAGGRDDPLSGGKGADRPAAEIDAGVASSGDATQRDVVVLHDRTLQRQRRRHLGGLDAQTRVQRLEGRCADLSAARERDGVLAPGAAARASVESESHGSDQPRREQEDERRIARDG